MALVTPVAKKVLSWQLINNKLLPYRREGKPIFRLIHECQGRNEDGIVLEDGRPVNHQILAVYAQNPALHIILEDPSLHNRSELIARKDSAQFTYTNPETKREASNSFSNKTDTDGLPEGVAIGFSSSHDPGFIHSGRVNSVFAHDKGVEAIYQECERVRTHYQGCLELLSSLPDKL